MRFIMPKKISRLVFVSALTLIASACKMTVTENAGKRIAFGTYQSSGGETVVFDRDTITVYNSSGSIEAKGYYKYIDGEIAVRFSEIYDADNNMHTLAGDSAAIRQKFDEIIALAVPKSREDVHWIYDYGIREYNYAFTNYEEAVNNILSRRVENYITLQRDMFLRATQKKFNDMHRFKYTIDDDGNVTMDQVFSNLTCSSSFFKSGDNVLNDFENNIPFLFETNGEYYIGNPSTSGNNFYATVMHYYDINEPVDEVVDYYKTMIEQILWDNETEVVAEAFYYELYIQRNHSAPEIPTAKKMIDMALTYEKLEGTFTLDDTPSLVISNVSCSFPELSGETISLGNFTPIVSFSGKILCKS